jgi:PIN domain nuclease of toxin-antitoxin system
MSSVVADTHALVWYLLNSPKLSKDARESMEEAVKAGNPIFVASISVVEILYLVEKGRLPASFLDRFLDTLQEDQCGIELASLDLAVIQTVPKISRQAVPDLPDRIIAATAKCLNLPLVTRDQKIRSADIQTIW